MSAYEKYREDLPELIRGRLDPERAGEILAAAQHDEVLRGAIEGERTLERWLEYYEIPEVSEGFQARFWRQFHEEKVVAGRRSVWLMRLVGPLAAAVLIAVGVILFVNNDTSPPINDTAQTDDAGEGTDTGDPVEVVWEQDEIDYVIGGEDVTPTREKLSADDLELMRALDDSAFLPLDDFDRPEDVGVIDDLELLKQLAEEE